MPSNPLQKYPNFNIFSIFLHSTFSLNSHLDSSPSTTHTLHEEVRHPRRLRRRGVRHRRLPVLLLTPGSQNVSPLSLPKIRLNYHFVNKSTFLRLVSKAEFFFFFLQDERRTRENASAQSSSSSSTEKFAPRFDGLRFIETLVTAHR